MFVCVFDFAHMFVLGSVNVCGGVSECVCLFVIVIDIGFVCVYV